MRLSNIYAVAHLIRALAGGVGFFFLIGLMVHFQDVLLETILAVVVVLLLVVAKFVDAWADALADDN